MGGQSEENKCPKDSACSPARADFCGANTDIFLDANTVINAVLLPQSFSAYAVALAAQRSLCRYLVTAGVMREVKKTLAKLAPDEGRCSVAESYVTAFLDRLGACQTDDDDLSPVPSSISKADSHVFHAAQRRGATVMTSDAGLWLGLSECDIPDLLPLEWIRQLDGMALATTIFGVPPTAVAGSVFIRAYPGAWAGVREGKFTAVSFPGGFWLYYDASQSSWVAKVPSLSKPLKVEAPIMDSTLQTVCLSWDAAGKRQIKLSVGGTEHPDSQPLCGPLDFRPSGHPTVDSLCGADHFWNGQIYFCVGNDRPVGNKSWNKYLRHRELAPNPYDADRVAAAIGALHSGAVSPAPIF